MKPLIGLLTLGNQYTDTREKIITNIKNGKLHAKKHIAGIPCPDSITTEQMLQFFTQENLQISNIKDALQNAGLPFKAIVPTSFYNEIKKKKGVYTFNHINDKGFTNISQDTVEHFVEKEEKAFNKLSVVLNLVLTIITSTCVLIAGEYYTWQWQLVHNSTTFDRVYNMCWFNIVIIIAVVLTYYSMNDGLKFLFSRFIFNTRSLWKRITTKLNKKSYETFWPEYHDNVSGPAVKLDFIKPDSDNIPSSILQWKKAGYDVHISAQKEAFSLNINSITTFLRELIDKLNEKRKLEVQAKIEARRAFWARFDPIISVEINEFTVLIDAYGGKSFVSEKEVMTNVMEYYGEKLKQFQTFLN